MRKKKSTTSAASAETVPSASAQCAAWRAFEPVQALRLDMLPNGSAVRLTQDNGDPHGARLVICRRWATIRAIEQANSAAGLYFFEPATLRFFRSKVSARTYGGGVFYTSETNPEGVERWTLRLADASGQVHTLGDFHAIPDGRTAAKLARIVARALNAGKVLNAGGTRYKLPQANG